MRIKADTNWSIRTNREKEKRPQTKGARKKDQIQDEWNREKKRTHTQQPKPNNQPSAYLNKSNKKIKRSDFLTIFFSVLEIVFYSLLLMLLCFSFCIWCIRLFEYTNQSSWWIKRQPTISSTHFLSPSSTSYPKTPATTTTATKLMMRVLCAIYAVSLRRSIILLLSFCCFYRCLLVISFVCRCFVWRGR